MAFCIEIEMGILFPRAAEAWRILVGQNPLSDARCADFYHRSVKVKDRLFRAVSALVGAGGLEPSASSV